MTTHAQAVEGHLAPDKIRTLRERAAEALTHFAEEGRRGKLIWRTEGVDAPKWVVDLCRAGHEDGRFLPDDHRYAFIVEALVGLAAADDPYDVYVEADVYTSELTAWLDSASWRIQYVTEALRESSCDDGYRLLAYAQEIEMNEVLGQVRNYLSTL